MSSSHDDNFPPCADDKSPNQGDAPLTQALSTPSTQEDGADPLPSDTTSPDEASNTSPNQGDGVGFTQKELQCLWRIFFDMYPCAKKLSRDHMLNLFGIWLRNGCGALPDALMVVTLMPPDRRLFKELDWPLQLILRRRLLASGPTLTLEDKLFLVKFTAETKEERDQLTLVLQKYITLGAWDAVRCASHTSPEAAESMIQQLLEKNDLFIPPPTFDVVDF